ncbi:MAG: hypothetical protein KIS88_04920 [Anaerolineales bacterium]|nr:hypothetical protein [Anaerolineales bacterium]
MKARQRAIYAWLIARFPAAYRARVGQSMLDTFDDLLEREQASLFNLYADACLHLLKENLMQTNLRFVIVAILALLCGFVPRALGLQVPGSVYVVWGVLALLIGAAQSDIRTMLVSGGLFGMLLALSLLAPGMASAPDTLGYVAMLVFVSLAAVGAGILAGAAGFWARNRLIS